MNFWNESGKYVCPKECFIKNWLIYSLKVSTMTKHHL